MECLYSAFQDFPCWWLRQHWLRGQRPPQVMFLSPYHESFYWTIPETEWLTSKFINLAPESNSMSFFSHNHFLDVNSRTPSLRFGTGWVKYELKLGDISRDRAPHRHIFSNVFENVTDSGVDSRDGAQTLIEDNLFQNVDNPIETTLNGGLWVATVPLSGPHFYTASAAPTKGITSSLRLRLIPASPSAHSPASPMLIREYKPFFVCSKLT